MANYTNVPNGLFDDLMDGKIDSKMFLILVWLLRRADYSSGVAIKVSAPRIRAEMWGDELEIPIPSLRTIQEDLKRLARSGYFVSHHIAGRKASYSISMNNYNTQIKGKDGALTPTVLRPVDTLCWRDLSEFRRADNLDVGRGDVSCDASSDAYGDVAQMLPRIHHTALDLPDSPDSPASPCSCSDKSDGNQTMEKDAAAENLSTPSWEEEMTTSSISVSVPSEGTATPSDSNPSSDSDGVGDKLTESERNEYEGVIALCSMWWSIHPEITSDPTPEPTTHPWGHPRTWSPRQRREVFLKARQYDNPNSLMLVVPDLAPETNTDSTADLDTQKDEARLLRDEGHMLKLVRMHGFESMYNLLFWLPKSDNWFERLKSLAQLESRQNWDYISADIQRYYDTARKNNNEEGCDEYVERVFLEAGGGAAGSIGYERLNPLPPLDPADAAEEQAAHAFDDEYGVDLFDPWAPFDHDDAVTESQGMESSDELFDPWVDGDAGDPADDSETPRANESGEVDDTEPEPPVARYCGDCGSAHAGSCIPSDLDFD